MDMDGQNSAEIMRGLRITSLDEEEEEEKNVDDDYGDVEDEDDDELHGPVSLGFLEKPEKSWSLQCHVFPSKAGGVPAWLDPVNLPSGKSILCCICEEPLQFLLQVYAPLPDKENAFHRTLYVFSCTSMSCILRDQLEQWKVQSDKPFRSVKVFCCQLHRTNSFYSSDPPRYDGTDKPLGVGAHLCTWCGTWKGDKVCSTCRKARYCSGKHQFSGCTLAFRSSGYLSKYSFSSESSDLQPHLNASSEEMPKAASRILWPEYEIKNEDECESDGEDSGALVDVTSKPSMDDFANDEDKISWVTFQERIGRAPEQVLRYCRDTESKPLWPTSSGRPAKTNIPKCSYCGSDRNFEFQILPQLLYYFGVSNDPGSLDWATIAVYTCASSCQDVRTAYKEEFAWVQLSSQTA